MFRRAAFAILALLSLPACHDGDGDDEPQFLSAALGGASASRTEFVIAPDGSNVAVSMTPDGSSAVQSAQVRSGSAAAGGPVLFEMSGVPAVLDASDLRPQGDIDTFAEAVDLLRQGGAFVTVRSAEFSGGQASGQIGPAAFRANLRNGSTDLGTALFVFDPAQTRVNFSMDTTTLTFPLTSASLQAGVGGPSFFDLSDSTSSGTLTGTLTSADLRPQPSAGIVTFDDALQAIMSGRTTLQVGTPVTPSAAGGVLQPSPPTSTGVAVPLPTGVPPTASPFTPAPTTPMVPTTPEVPAPSGVPPAPATPATPTPGFAPAPVFTPSFTPEPVFPGVTPPSSTPSPGMPQPSSTPTSPPPESAFVPRPAPPPPSTFSPATTTTTTPP